MDTCKWQDLKVYFYKHQVHIHCTGCGLKVDIPTDMYFKKWGYPKSQEKLTTFEWLHEMEKKVGRDFMERVKIFFIDTNKNVTLGSSNIPFSGIEKLKIGDVLEFKDTASIFGFYYISSFAVNSGSPEGSINLTPVTAKAKIKLQEVNDEYLDSLLPF